MIPTTNKQEVLKGKLLGKYLSTDLESTQLKFRFNYPILPSEIYFLNKNILSEYDSPF